MKEYLKSRTIWINIIAVIAIVSAGEFGIILNGTIQAAILAMINIVMRKITNEELVWSIK